MLSKEVSSTILKDFGMMRPRIEPRSSRPLAKDYVLKMNLGSFKNVINKMYLQWPRDFVLYILPFGLVRLSTFCFAHGFIRCNMSAGVHACARRMCHSEMSK